MPHSSFRFRWHLAWSLAGVLSLSLAAQNSGNSAASSNGFIVGSNPQGATVQGQNALPGTAVMPGEQVNTNSGGSITLVGSSSQGGVVQIGHQTNSTIVNSSNGPQVNLSTGYAQVQGQIPVGTCNSVVQPTNSQTNVTVVANSCNQTLVQQNSGTATVHNISTSTTQSQTLNTGNSVSVTSSAINTVPTSVVINAANTLAPTAPPANGNGNNGNNNNNNNGQQNSATGEPG